MSLNNQNHYTYIDNKTVPIVFIHGVGLDRNMWLPQINYFKNYSTLTYDLLGHGDSKDPEGKISLSLFADQLLQIINHIKLEKIAGFRPETGRYKWITDGSARIWLGRVFPNAMMFPVRIKSDTNFGGLFVHLISAEQVFNVESTKFKCSYNKKK